MLFVGTIILAHSMTANDKSSVFFCFVVDREKIVSSRFEGQRQSIDTYGRQQGQESQEKFEFKSLSVNPAEKKAAKPAAEDDDDVDLFGDEDEEESEQTKQRLAAYAEKKSNSK